MSLRKRIQKKVLVATLLASQLLGACAQSGQARKNALDKAFPKDRAAIGQILEDDKLTKVLGAEAKDLYEAEEKVVRSSRGLSALLENLMSEEGGLKRYMGLITGKGRADWEYLYFNRTYEHNFFNHLAAYSTSAQEFMFHVDHLERLGFTDLAKQFRKLMAGIQRDHLKVVKEFAAYLHEIIAVSRDEYIRTFFLNVAIDIYKAYAAIPGNEEIAAFLAKYLIIMEQVRLQIGLTTGRPIQLNEDIPALLKKR